MLVSPQPIKQMDLSNGNNSIQSQHSPLSQMSGTITNSKPPPSISTNLNRLRTKLKEDPAPPESSPLTTPTMSPSGANSRSRTQSDSTQTHTSISNVPALIQLPNGTYNLPNEPSQVSRSTNTNCSLNPIPLPLELSGVDFEKLKSEWSRLETFHNPNYPWPVEFVNPEDCSAAGFFFLQVLDRVQCAFCRGVAGEWEVGDIPQNEHKKHFPRCPFLCHLPVGNIPISTRGSSPGSSTSPTSSNPEPEQVKTGFDVCGAFLPPGFTNNGPTHSPVDSVLRSDATQPLTIAQPLNGVTRLAIDTGCGPARRHLVTFSARVKTYTKDWPTAATGLSPEQMSEAGFFYIGTQDHVKCFYCDGGLRNWEPGDDPWFEHARWFSKCPFVLLMKGQDYVGEVGLVRPPVDSDSASSDEESSNSLSHSQPASSSSSSEDMEHEIPASHFSQNKSEIGSSSAEHNTDTLGVETGCNNDEEISTTMKTSAETTVERKVELEEEIRQLKEARQCKICMDNEVGVVFLPCGHLVSCVRCATALTNCALCREPIKAMVRTYLS